MPHSALGPCAPARCELARQQRPHCSAPPQAAQGPTRSPIRRAQHAVCIWSECSTFCHGPDTRAARTGVYKGVTTSELDELAAETAASLTATHPDYAILAARIAISNLHKSTLKSFSASVKLLHDHISPKTGAPCNS